MIHIKIPMFSYAQSPILRDIDKSFKTGETHGVVGLNGAGKTTLFNLIAGFIKDPNCVISKDEKAVERKQIAYLNTELFFYPKLTAKEFLSVFPSTNSSYQEVQLAEIFKLPLNGFMSEFSTGMKKKLLLLSQIKQDKEIYILDEPFNGLDLETNKMLEIIIALLNERGKTVFISSHILQPLLNVCSEVNYLKNQTIFRSYQKNEFDLIEDDLFGTYTNNLKSELPKYL